MDAAPVRNFTRLAIAIIIAALVISAAALSYSSLEATVTKTLTTSTTSTSTSTTTVTQTNVVTTTKTTTLTTTSSSVYSYCSVDSPSAGTYLRAVLDSNGQPLWNTIVLTTPVANGTCYGQGSPATSETNASGWASLGALEGGAYLGVSLGYAGQTYNFSLPQVSLDETKATVSLPSGRVSVTICHGPSCTIHNQSASITQPIGTNALQLQLSLGVNGTGGVTIIVDDFNTLPTANSVTAGDRWTIPLNGLNGAPCGGEENGWPVGFAVTSGRYTSSNITDAKLLDLVNPNALYYCPPYIGAFGDAVAYTFEPLSDTAAGTGCPVNYCPTETVTTGVGSPSLGGGVTGYWSQGGAFTTFSKGTYTVLAEDEWGHSTLGYFTIP